MLRSQNRSEFNVPQKTGARLTVLVFLTAVVVGICLLITGLLLREIRLVSAGAFSLVTTAFVRSCFSGRSWIEETLSANGQRAESGRFSDELQAVRIDELVELLRRWEGLEHERGLPGFDSSALQTVRHEIREIVHADPTLEGLFRSSAHAA